MSAFFFGALIEFFLIAHCFIVARSVEIEIKPPLLTAVT